MTLYNMALSRHLKIYTCWTAVPGLILELWPAGFLEASLLVFQKVIFNLAMPLSPSSYLFQMFPLERIELQLPAALGIPDWLTACSLNRVVLDLLFFGGFFNLILLDFTSSVFLLWLIFSWSIHPMLWQPASHNKPWHACGKSEWSTRLAFPNH